MFLNLLTSLEGHHGHSFEELVFLDTYRALILIRSLERSSGASHPGVAYMKRIIELLDTRQCKLLCSVRPCKERVSRVVIPIRQECDGFEMAEPDGAVLTCGSTECITTSKGVPEIRKNKDKIRREVFTLSSSGCTEFMERYNCESARAGFSSLLGIAHGVMDKYGNFIPDELDNFFSAPEVSSDYSTEMSPFGYGKCRLCVKAETLARGVQLVEYVP